MTNPGGGGGQKQKTGKVWVQSRDGSFSEAKSLEDVLDIGPLTDLDIERTKELAARFGW